MGLPKNLISEFVKITNDTPPAKKESTVYGTIKTEGESTYVKLDGSDILTPVSSTVDVKDGNRVLVMIKNHTATVTGNISSPASSVDRVTIMETTISNKIDANIANLGLVYANKITVDSIQTDLINTNTLVAGKASISDLSATNVVVGTLNSQVGGINTLMFGSASGTTIQTSFSNEVVAQIGNAQIKSAMIDSISASKITSGDIITNNVTIKSNDNGLVISDGTIQIKDSTRVRVQIGKDESNDYSINIWDTSGNLMFSKGGITESAIKNAIIRNDMVSETANISASKLDIDSLFEKINGSTKTITASKIYLDDKKQTLDVSFLALSNTVADQSELISSQGTAISTIQGQISSKIWQQDINTVNDAMTTKYSTLEQTLTSFRTSVGETNSAMSTKITTLEQTAAGLSVAISDAAKTASNYLNFSTDGLVVGDMTTSSLGKNVRIDSDSIDIRNGNTVLASFGEDYLYLAKHSRNATIDLCNGLAQMYHEIDSKGYSVFNIDTTYGLSYIKMSAPMHDLLVLENTNSTNGVIIKGMINGTTVGGFGLVRDGYMVRYGSDADEDNPVEYAVLDTGNFLTEMDDGWHYTGGYGDDFTQYNNENYSTVRYRKIGGMVEVRGVMRPRVNIAGSTTQYELFQLPEGYRPDSYIYQRCSGSYAYTWLLTISPSGKASFSRYGDGSSYVNIDTTAWLPFQVTFFVN